MVIYGYTELSRQSIIQNSQDIISAKIKDFNTVNKVLLEDITKQVNTNDRILENNIKEADARLKDELRAQKAATESNMARYMQENNAAIKKDEGRVASVELGLEGIKSRMPSGSGVLATAANFNVINAKTMALR